jgi:hypothetical protein
LARTDRHCIARPGRFCQESNEKYAEPPNYRRAAREASWEMCASGRIRLCCSEPTLSEYLPTFHLTSLSGSLLVLLLSMLELAISIQPRMQQVWTVKLQRKPSIPARTGRDFPMLFRTVLFVSLRMVRFSGGKQYCRRRSKRGATPGVVFVTTSPSRGRLVSPFHPLLSVCPTYWQTVSAQDVFVTKPRLLHPP